MTAMGGLEFRRGMHELGRGTWAYLSPPGTWGWSNCGLLVSGRDALLVDTQFDLPLTRDLLAAVAALRPDVQIRTVVTTHANGDHCWGNQLINGVEIIGSAACGHGMGEEVQPAELAALSGHGSPGTPLGDYMRRHFGGFDFTGIEVTPPTRTFSGRLDVAVGDRRIELLEVGPAHTDGDVIVHVPDAGVVYAGDILFIGGHPIMWTGPVQNWIAACDRITATGAERIVPGHGPVTDPSGVAEFRGYLEWVAERAEKAYASGLPYWEAGDPSAIPPAYARWGNPERLVITMATAYRYLGDPAHDLMEVLAHTAEGEAKLRAR
ncbi:MBL fold metallo-hydrolase [Actinoplanes sp. NPDC049118]|uniref:MBL fold metallo-hydrolase n=1 Tax=Actinoplanes sp. NPDC049118 TaxID=3155769 RepID=UPI00340D7907